MSAMYHSNESRFIKFSLLIVFGVPSIICALYIIYNIIRFRSLRQQFQNETLIILIFVVLFNTFCNIPTAFSFYVRGQALHKSETFCHIWQIIDYIFTASIIWCKAIFTAERYILIFYPNHLRSQQQKFIFHYIPLVLINLYLILFYIFVNVFCPNNPKLEYDRYLCGEQCLDQMSGISIFNWFFNILFPVFVIIFGSLFLLLRVLWTRRAMQRNLRNWSKNWKMILQLLGIAIVYAIVWLPLSIISLITMFHPDQRSTESIADHFYFITYLCEMIVPIIALFFWPEIMQKIRRNLRPNAVASTTIRPYSTY